MRLLAALTILFLGAAGCYNPSIADGAQQCSTDGKCADGLTCFKPNNSCYRIPPACSPACSGMSAICDVTQPTPKCVGCLADKDCPAGDVCNPGTKTCRTGCSAAHPSCLADAGTCDVDAGACRGCNSDTECAAGDQANPRCDLTSGHCQPCLPNNDNCTGGKYCAPVAGGYACTDGCQTKADCKNGTIPDCCNHKCVDTALDALNCGACAKACPMGNACCAGACSDPTSDVANCGGCGMSCMPANVATAACASSACGFDRCQAGFGNCDMNQANGCETNVATDPNRCGGCTNVCPAPPNAVAGCAMGSCTVGMCFGGYGDCNMNVADGCEANLNTDAGNCKTCGAVCPLLPHAVPGCKGGACGIGMCLMGYADCDMNAATGCEINIGSDPNNCGLCNVACNLPNASSICSGGKCAIAMCKPNYTDCDRMAANGCEANTQTDPKNCGGCGAACNLPNAVANCAAGACTVASCNANYADCDKVAANGCEANTQTDAKNCGGCGKVCGANITCTNGVCGANGCTNNALWAPVTCTDPSWDWSLDRTRATDRVTANALHVLATSNASGNDKCSVLGTGWVSTKDFVLANCNTLVYHLGGTYTGNCGGHDGEPYRLLVLGVNDCYPY